MLTAGCSSTHEDNALRAMEQGQKTWAGANDPADAKLLAINLLKPKHEQALSVTSDSFNYGKDIPYRHSDYGDRLSPQLMWKNVPSGTQSFVILMEDPDATLPKPFIHWILYNLPADSTELHRAIPTEMQLMEFGNARQGTNSRGSVGYFGCRPPYKDAAHHYHFQVFALDTVLDVPLAPDRQAVLKAMEGHVLASGELMGRYKAAKE